MVANPFADTGPRVQQLCEGSYPERGVGPQGSADAGLCVKKPQNDKNVFMPKKSLLLIGITVIVIIAAVGASIWYFKFYPEALKQKKLNEIQNKITATQNQITQLQNIVDGTKNIPAESLNIPNSATTDIPIKGVTISKSQDGKTKQISNTIQGYTFEIPSFLVMARGVDSTDLEFYNPETMCIVRGCPPEISVLVKENKANRSLDDFIRTEGYFNLAEKKIIVIGGETAYEFLFEADNLPSKNVYFITKKNSVYKLNLVKNPEYKMVADSFRFVVE